MKDLDLNLTKALLNSVTSVLQDSSKARAEQAKATNEQLAARYKAMPKPTSLEDAKVESYAAKAPERRVNDTIAAVYKKSVSEHAAQVKQESDAIKNAYAARGGVKPVAESIIVEGQGVHVLDDEGETHVHIKDAKNVKEVDDAVVQHLVTKHKMSPEKARKTYREVSSDTPFHHDKPEKGHSVDVVRSKAEHAKQVGDYVHSMVSEALSPKQKTIDINKNKKIDAFDLKTLRDRRTAAQTGDVADETILDGEAIVEKEGTMPKTPREKDLAAKAHPKDKITHKDVMVARGVVAKEEKDTPGNSYDHQCAIHVKHAKLGEGRTLFSQHAEPDAEGQIAWYDVMFAESIEKKVPTTDLEILVSESHMNHKKKKM